MLAMPAPRSLPPVLSELRQPSIAPTAELFAHGHAVPVPSPGQKGVPVVADPVVHVARRTHSKPGPFNVFVAEAFWGGTELAVRLAGWKLPVLSPMNHASPSRTSQALPSMGAGKPFVCVTHAPTKNTPVTGVGVVKAMVCRLLVCCPT